MHIRSRSTKQNICTKTQHAYLNNGYMDSCWLGCPIEGPITYSSDTVCPSACAKRVYAHSQKKTHVKTLSGRRLNHVYTLKSWLHQVL